MTLKVDEIFTKRLTEAINLSRHTRKGFAESIGVTESTVQRWLNGQAHPTMNKIQAIADLLEVSPQWLFGANEVSKRDRILESCNSTLKSIRELENLEVAQEAIQAIYEGESSKYANELDEELDSFKDKIG